MRCGKVQSSNIDLKSIPFCPIIFPVNRGNKLKFEINDASFKLVNLENKIPTPEDENLTKEIESKRKRIEILKKKIIEIEEKHEQMMKILNIDINEREYILEAKLRYEKSK